MPTPQLLNDIISLLLLLAPSAALVSLVLAGVTLRREGGTVFAIGGGFTKWMFWAVVFLTLQPLLTWFSSFGIRMPLPGGGISTPWLASIQSDVASFVTNFVVGRIVPTLAAFFVLRAILDTASGEHPLPSIIAAMFLLGTQTTFNLIQSYNTQTKLPRPMCWTVCGITWPERSCRSQRSLALVGAILNFATRKPFMRLVAVALALLCVSGIWKLVVAMVS